MTHDLKIVSSMTHVLKYSSQYDLNNFFPYYSVFLKKTFQFCCSLEIKNSRVFANVIYCKSANGACLCHLCLRNILKASKRTWITVTDSCEELWWCHMCWDCPRKDANYQIQIILVNFTRFHHSCGIIAEVLTKPTMWEQNQTVSVSWFTWATMDCLGCVKFASWAPLTLSVLLTGCHRCGNGDQTWTEGAQAYIISNGSAFSSRQRQMHDK